MAAITATTPAPAVSLFLNFCFFKSVWSFLDNSWDKANWSVLVDKIELKFPT